MGTFWQLVPLWQKNYKLDVSWRHMKSPLNLPLQIVDIGNGCEAYSASIYIPAKSELTATLHSITRSQFFLDYNFNYTYVSNFLVWYKLDFAKLTDTEIKTLKAKVL